LPDLRRPEALPPDAGWPAADAQAEHFRQVLGHFCTGVTVITAVGDPGPAGFACQAFAALSLEPPLVLFCPAGPR
jgi:3-hydroxy-9,10-secoandrosta-1,3,5(10)-triene-9,17-dione monooxygenase reductase component